MLDASCMLGGSWLMAQDSWPWLVAHGRGDWPSPGAGEPPANSGPGVLPGPWGRVDPLGHEP